jgi:predicted enzyme related to lactoylglutathione lyase
VTSVGSTSLHRPGTLTWIELETTDLDRACKFYGQLFDWDAGQVDSPAHPGGYTVFTRNGDRVAGATESPLTDLAASWCPSFAVPDVDAATDAAVANGGVVMFEPGVMAVGRQSVLVDPVGAVFALLGPVPRGPRPL